ncbi:ribonuclease H-like YkuK family protein [Salibacter sp.]|uniref:ribonuclease H-like YkuK family protein n=1 Tax=Salibacter sp. TaxID=2010995 RepID=UPI0028708161|nr:ribonuclease H-like YkuK family protein [Salibacter sp.]MDR9398780.1 ribonuclease H-like YkuK family protein [Salibacter sp.]MDR9487880.1 ribonuclease H-like YkuK family protein [Salibacter sp.]
MRFKMMQTKREVELKSYLLSFLADKRDYTIHVGCDSQNFSSKTVYVTTVVVRFQNRGAHVLYKKEVVPKIIDMWTRLWAEIERSVELATYLEEDCGIEVSQVDMDFNEDPQFPSNKVLKAASGYVSSMGFIVKAKPNLLMATWAANVLCH